MAERIRSFEPGASNSEEPLAETLRRYEEEIERLRQLLIAKDLELGTVRGRLAELEQRLRQLLGVAARFPRMLRFFAAVLRRLTRRRI